MKKRGYEILERKVDFFSEVPIIDNEISNDIGILGWDYEKAKPCIVGILFKNKITQFVLYENHKEIVEKFKAELMNFLDELPKPLFAFNTKMERGNFKGFLNREYRFEEIKPFNGKGASKEYFFRFLLEKGLIVKTDSFEDPLRGNSRLVMSRWESERYEDVVKHNICCLVKEFNILENKKKITQEHNNILNESGWLKDGVVLN